MDSPLTVTSADSADMGSMCSREAGRDSNLFQGPGESPDKSGDGKGVTSGIALSMGEEKADGGAELRLELLPMLFANTFLILGVRVMRLDGRWVDSVAVCVVA